MLVPETAAAAVAAVNFSQFWCHTNRHYRRTHFDCCCCCFCRFLLYFGCICCFSLPPLFSDSDSAIWVADSMLLLLLGVSDRVFLFLFAFICSVFLLLAFPPKSIRLTHKLCMHWCVRDDYDKEEEEDESASQSVKEGEWMNE